MTAVTGKRTTAVEFLTIFGVPYLAALALIGVGLWRVASAEYRVLSAKKSAGSAAAPTQHPALSPRHVVVVLAVALLAAIVLSAPLVILCGVPLAGAVVLLRRQREIAPRTIALALFAFGLALILLTEFFYIQDVFQSRMNTLFKVYYQAWTLFALATALAVVLLWQATGGRRQASGVREPMKGEEPVTPDSRRPSPVACRLAVGTVVAVALAAGLVFTALAPYAFTSHFASWQGLDGSAYLTASGDGAEVAAFNWLRQHATSKDVLLEAPGCSYEPFGEMPYDSAAAFSGVPTVIGWIQHEQQWRNGQPALYAEIGTRAEQVPGMYADPSGALAKQYGVTLLYVGRYEQQPSDPQCSFDGKGPYPAVNSPSFPGPGWTEVFHQGDVRIYRRG